MHDRWAEAEVAERPPKRVLGDSRRVAGAAGARNEVGWHAGGGSRGVARHDGESHAH